MAATTLSAATVAGIEQMKSRYEEEHPASKSMFERARHVLAGGTSHNYRTSSPFPLYWSKGAGAKMWDIDGREYVDFALYGASAITGHGDERIADAINSYDATLGGATNTEIEVAWGERIKALYPAADLVRFTGSGSDSSTLAFRLVRAYTGKDKILRFQRAYHGWHDHASIAYLPPYDQVPSGIPEGEADYIIAASLDGDLAPVETLLERDDIAGMIVEPSGAGMGMNPLDPDKLVALRRLAREHSVPFICDENITGFRWAPGGIQEQLDLDPDVTLLGKIATGGFPGGVVCGKNAILGLLADGVRSTVSHSGTFNGHPVTATAAIATIDAIADGEPQKAAAEFASKLQAEINMVLSELGVLGFAYGPSSTYWVYLHPADAEPVSLTPGKPDFDSVSPPMLSGTSLEMVEALYCGLCSEGVFNSIFNGGFTSSVHGPDELEATLAAYRTVITELRDRRIVAAA